MDGVQLAGGDGQRKKYDASGKERGRPVGIIGGSEPAAFT